MDNENKKELLSLIFDSDIIYQISYGMCVKSLHMSPFYQKRKSEKQKQEEDLYVIEKNLGEINRFFKEIKKQNNLSNYMNLLRHLDYVQKPKYSTVFNYEDPSDKIYLIMKGEVCILLPDSSYETNRYSMEIKRNAQKKLQILQTKHKELKALFDQHNNPNFAIKRVYQNPSDDDDDDDEEEEDEETLQPWGLDSTIVSLLYPELFCADTMIQNDFFGVIGVEFNVPRSATVVCKTDCEFAVIPAKAYHETINQKYYGDDNSIKNIQNQKFVTRLRNVNDMFKTMSKQMINVFASNTRVQICNSNTEIFKIGDKADYIYFIEKGEVEITQNYSSYDIKMPSDDMEINSIYSETSASNSIADFSVYKLKAAILDKGCYFGEDGIILKRSEGTRTTTAVAKCQCALLKMSKDFFNNNFKAYIESDKLSEKIVQDNLKTIKMKTQENEEYEQFYSSIISKKVKEKVQQKHNIQKKHSSNSQVAGRQDTQLSDMLMEDDDILNTKNLKKNLFQIYRDEKSVSEGNSRNTLQTYSKFKRDSTIIPPPINIQKRSTLKLDCEVQSQFECLLEELLYPNVNENLNPNLFIKKPRKKIKRLKSQSQIADQNLNTPNATLNYLGETAAQSHTNFKFKNSFLISNSQVTLNKIVQIQSQGQSGTRSNQQTPVKIATPQNARAQSALNNKKNQLLNTDYFQFHNKNVISPSYLQNSSQIQDQSEIGIKIMENGQILQEIHTPQKINSSMNNGNNPLPSFQSFVQSQNDEKPNSVDKQATKNSFFLGTTIKTNVNHRKSQSYGGSYIITRSLKEEEGGGQQNTTVNKSRISQSQSHLKDLKDQPIQKERYGIDSKFLIKEKLNFLVNAQQQIYQQQLNIYKKPLIKFKSINAIPYQTGKVSINHVKKFSTLDAQSLIQKNSEMHQQIINHSIHNNTYMNNSLAKSPIPSKGTVDMKSNSSVATFFTFRGGGAQSNNNFRIHQKLNNQSLTNHQISQI